MTFFTQGNNQFWIEKEKDSLLVRYYDDQPLRIEGSDPFFDPIKKITFNLPSNEITLVEHKKPDSFEKELKKLNSVLTTDFLVSFKLSLLQVAHITKDFGLEIVLSQDNVDFYQIMKNKIVIRLFSGEIFYTNLALKFVLTPVKTPISQYFLGMGITTFGETVVIHRDGWKYYSSTENNTQVLGDFPNTDCAISEDGKNLFIFDNFGKIIDVAVSPDGKEKIVRRYQSWMITLSSGSQSSKISKDIDLQFSSDNLHSFSIFNTPNNAIFGITVNDEDRVNIIINFNTSHYFFLPHHPLSFNSNMSDYIYQTEGSKKTYGKHSLILKNNFSIVYFGKNLNAKEKRTKKEKDISQNEEEYYIFHIRGTLRITDVSLNVLCDINGVSEFLSTGNLGIIFNTYTRGTYSLISKAENSGSSVKLILTKECDINYLSNICGIRPPTFLLGNFISRETFFLRKGTPIKEKTANFCENYSINSVGVNQCIDTAELRNFKKTSMIFKNDVFISAFEADSKIYFMSSLTKDGNYFNFQKEGDFYNFIIQDKSVFELNKRMNSSRIEVEKYRNLNFEDVESVESSLILEYKKLDKREIVDCLTQVEKNKYDVKFYAIWRKKISQDLGENNNIDSYLMATIGTDEVLKNYFSNFFSSHDFNFFGEYSNIPFDKDFVFREGFEKITLNNFFKLADSNDKNEKFMAINFIFYMIRVVNYSKYSQKEKNDFIDSLQKNYINNTKFTEKKKFSESNSLKILSDNLENVNEYIKNLSFYSNYYTIKNDQYENIKRENFETIRDPKCGIVIPKGYVIIDAEDNNKRLKLEEEYIIFPSNLDLSKSQIIIKKNSYVYNPLLGRAVLNIPKDTKIYKMTDIAFFINSLIFITPVEISKDGQIITTKFENFVNFPKDSNSNGDIYYNEFGFRMVEEPQNEEIYILKDVDLLFLICKNQIYNFDSEIDGGVYNLECEGYYFNFNQPSMFTPIDNNKISTPISANININVLNNNLDVEQKSLGDVFTSIGGVVERVCANLNTKNYLNFFKEIEKIILSAIFITQIPNYLVKNINYITREIQICYTNPNLALQHKEVVEYHYQIANSFYVMINELMGNIQNVLLIFDGSESSKINNPGKEEALAILKNEENALLKNIYFFTGKKVYFLQVDDSFNVIGEDLIYSLDYDDEEIFGGVLSIKNEDGSNGKYSHTISFASINTRNNTFYKNILTLSKQEYFTPNNYREEIEFHYGDYVDRENSIKEIEQYYTNEGKYSQEGIIQHSHPNYLEENSRYINQNLMLGTPRGFIFSYNQENPLKSFKFGVFGASIFSGEDVQECTLPFFEKVLQFSQNKKTLLLMCDISQQYTLAYEEENKGGNVILRFLRMSEISFAEKCNVKTESEIFGEYSCTVRRGMRGTPSSPGNVSPGAVPLDKKSSQKHKITKLTGPGTVKDRAKEYEKNVPSRHPAYLARPPSVDIPAGTVSERIRKIQGLTSAESPPSSGVQPEGVFGNVGAGPLFDSPPPPMMSSPPPPMMSSPPPPMMSSPPPPMMSSPPPPMMSSPPPADVLPLYSPPPPSRAVTFSPSPDYHSLPPLPPLPTPPEEIRLPDGILPTVRSRLSNTSSYAIDINPLLIKNISAIIPLRENIKKEDVIEELKTLIYSSIMSDYFKLLLFSFVRKEFLSEAKTTFFLTKTKNIKLNAARSKFIVICKLLIEALTFVDFTSNDFNPSTDGEEKMNILFYIPETSVDLVSQFLKEYYFIKKKSIFAEWPSDSSEWECTLVKPIEESNNLPSIDEFFET